MSDTKIAEGKSLTEEAIQKYINPKATKQEAYMFLQLCRTEGLNPFLKEAYLIKYSADQPATMVVSINVFVKRAQRNPEFDGYEGGVITVSNGEQMEKIGSFYDEDTETLVGAWATVHHKNRTHPTKATVRLKEFEQDNKIWKQKPATMIEKVALAKALRLTFMEDLGQLYEIGEINVADTQSPSTPVNQLPSPEETTEGKFEDVDNSDELTAYQDWNDRCPNRKSKLWEPFTLASAKRFYIKMREKDYADENAKEWVVEALGEDNMKQIFREEGVHWTSWSMKDVVGNPLLRRDLNIAFYEHFKEILFE